MEIDSYDIDLDVDFPNATVDGTVTMQLRRGEVPFVLDAVDLEIRSVRVDGHEALFSHDKKAGALRVEGVPRGESSVRVDYHKKVSDDVIYGLYKSKYGKDYFLATDLEPAQARTVFPCKDHPAFKAVFKLAVTTQKGLTVISNTPAATRRTTGNRVRFGFEPTPPMSTYLFFLGVGKFEQISKKQAGLEVLVACRPGESKNGRFILDIGAGALEFYQSYFGVPYPLKKLHMVALPEYQTGAMENWGAITSRESCLVNERSSVSDRQGAGLVMAHEIAHQWFGDLVTMKWWDDIWLNESFATFMECKAIEKLHPDWDPWTFFLRTATFRSQATDALSTTHPIQVEVKSPQDAGEVFDAISYGKGASVLRMLESYVGKEAFRRGVSSYLKRFSYANAAGQDLWQSVQKASGLPVSRVMGQWITKPGSPLVRVGYGKGKLTFSQRRFQLDGKGPRDTWPIPLTLELNGVRKTMLFDKPEMQLDAPGLESLNVNTDHSGFYSVLYAPELEEMVRRGFSRLSPYDKGGFMSDLFLFLQAGLVDPREYYRFVSLCAREKHPLVVETVADQLSLLRAIAGESDALRRCAVTFVSAQIKRLGLSPKKGESPHDSVARELVSALASRLDTDYTRKLAAMFSDYDRVDPNLRGAVAVAFARTSGGSAFEPLAKMVKSMKSEVDRSRIYSALTSFTDPSVVGRALELGLSGAISRSDSAYTMTSASANPLARDVLWKWIQKRHDKLLKLYAGSQQLMLYYEVVIPRCAVGKVDEIKRFFSEKDTKKGKLFVKRIIETAEIRTKLRESLLAS
ncbi:MAG TPA: M1 family metallopeptidase [Nitrososphaerales archaeon]|nr:M1 family metallopeptidase [Nitrososphaerales archaeon]